jgi:bifunctional non-homologous end joining protein LigD
VRLRLVKEPFDNPDYIFELKHDGFRALAYVDARECRLVSRNLRSLRFEYLRAALGKLRVKNAIIDGEIVCLDANGISQFNALLTTKGHDAAAFYAFDLIWLNGADLRLKPLMERKARLRELVRKSRCPRLLYAQHVEGGGKRVVQRNLPLRSGRYRGETKDGDVSGGPPRLAKDQE